MEDQAVRARSARRLHARSGRAQDTTFAANFRRGIRARSPDRALQDVLGVALSLLLRSSIAQSAAMVRRSLVMWVALTLPKVAGVRVGSSKSRTCFEAVAATPPESNCLIASIVAKRCAVVSFIASRFLYANRPNKMQTSAVVIAAGCLRREENARTPPTMMTYRFQYCCIAFERSK